MIKLINLVLLLALIATAIALVRVSYDTRRLYAVLDRAQSEERHLEVEHERLQAEKQAQATPSRVEAVARQQLAMRTATPAITTYVTAPRAAAQEPAR